MVDMLRLFYKNILSISILFCYLSVIINNSIFYLALITLLVIYIGLLGERALSSSEAKLLRYLVRPFKEKTYFFGIINTYFNFLDAI
jgi:hypothetical protein